MIIYVYNILCFPPIFRVGHKSLRHGAALSAALQRNHLTELALLTNLQILWIFRKKSFLHSFLDILNAPLLQEPWRESFQKHRLWGRQPSPLPVIKYWSINMTPLIGCWPWHPRRSAPPSSRSRPRPWGRSCSPPAAWRSRRTHWRRRSGAASCCSSPPENCLNFVRCLLDVLFTRPMSAPSLTSLLTVSNCEVKKINCLFYWGVVFTWLRLVASMTAVLPLISSHRSRSHFFSNRS